VVDGARDSPGMNTQSHAGEKCGFLGIVEGIGSDEKARFIKADLEDLPGVYGVEVLDKGVRICFNPIIVREGQFERAVGLAGFKASGFHMAA
jgi:hypothetical protein